MVADPPKLIRISQANNSRSGGVFRHSVADQAEVGIAGKHAAETTLSANRSGDC